METKRKHVAVIGRGIVGLSIVRRLAQAGFRVTLIGPKHRPGTASYAAVGVSTLKGWAEPRQPLFEAKFLGHGRLPRWLDALEQESGQSISRHFDQVLEPFATVEHFQWIRERVFHRLFTGLMSAQHVKNTEETICGWKACGYFSYFGDGWFDPRATMKALDLLSTRYCADIIDKNVIRVESGQLGQLTAICDDKARSFDEVVVAAGVFSGEILEASDVRSLTMTPVSGVTVGGNVESLSNKTLLFGKMAFHCEGGRAYFGSTSDNSGLFCDAIGFRDEAIESQSVQLLDFIRENCYSWDQQEVLWGVRSRLRDRQPAVGTVKIGGGPNMWVAIGLYKNGLQLADLVAENLCSQLSGRSPSPLFAHFSPNRFSQPA